MQPYAESFVEAGKAMYHDYRHENKSTWQRAKWDFLYLIGALFNISAWAGLGREKSDKKPGEPQFDQTKHNETIHYVN